MKNFVMLSFLFSILGCSLNNTTELRFEQGRAVFWPQWKDSKSENMQPLSFLVGRPDKPASGLKDFTVFLSNGKSITLSSETIYEDITQRFINMDDFDTHEYDMSGRRGPSLHPGKPYFVCPSGTRAVSKYGLFKAFFTGNKLISISFHNESDDLDRVVFNGETFTFPLKLKDLKAILGDPIEKLRYLSQ